MDLGIMICPALPGGYEIGKTVWAAEDIGEPVFVQKFVQGIVQGPSTSDDKTHISVRWEKLKYSVLRILIYICIY